MMAQYEDKRKQEAEALDAKILVATATDIETKALHAVMQEPIVRVVCGNYTYYIGKVGLYRVVHVQCSQMGSLSPGGSSQTLNAALREWTGVKAVIMVGICFGFDDTKQKIGDVIVANSITNYETRRMGEKEEIPRGGTFESDRCLLNAFNNLKLSWENIGIDDEKKKLKFGLYVSGEQLVDNKVVRDKLLQENPEAKAGEMEGNGVIAACKAVNIPWILVKAICDFGDGHKGVDKERRQAIAAASAASCFAAAMEQSTAFEAIGIRANHGAEPIEEPSARTMENLDVLFELYRKEYAPYFLRRNIDADVESYILTHNLWIYGISGGGKSTSILHALTTQNKTVILVNMAGVDPKGSVGEIYEWIYNEVAGIVGETTQAPPTYQLCMKRIIKMLDSHYAGKEVFVVVEELPFSGERLGAFVVSFSSLVVSDKLTGDSVNVHFILSSIENPLPHVPPYQQKIKSMMKFLEFGTWTEEECVGLIDLIRANMTTPFVNDAVEMAHLCKHLPRPIKTVFREAYHTSYKGNLDRNKINSILARL